MVNRENLKVSNERVTEQELVDRFENIKKEIKEIGGDDVDDEVKISKGALNGQFAEFLLRNENRKALKFLKSDVDKFRKDWNRPGAKAGKGLEELAVFLDDITNDERMEKDYDEFIDRLKNKPKSLNKMGSWEIRRLNLYLGMHKEKAWDVYELMKGIFGKYEEKGMKEEDILFFNTVWNNLKINYKNSDFFMNKEYPAIASLQPTVKSLKLLAGGNWDGSSETIVISEVKNSIVDKSIVIVKVQKINEERIKSNKDVVKSITVKIGDVSKFTKKGEVLNYEGQEFTVDKMMEFFGDEIKKSAGDGTEFVNDDERDKMINDCNGEIFMNLKKSLLGNGGVREDNSDSNEGGDNGGNGNDNGGSGDNNEGGDNGGDGDDNEGDGDNNEGNGNNDEGDGNNDEGNGDNDETLTQSDLTYEENNENFKIKLSGLDDAIKGENGFYDGDKSGEKIHFNINNVKKYLEEIQNKTWKELEVNPSSPVERGKWTIAVQIILNYLAEKNGKSDYNVHYLDGIRGEETLKGVKAFQADNGLNFKNNQPDGLPGPVTIKKLLKVLGGQISDKGKDPDKSKDGNDGNKSDKSKDPDKSKDGNDGNKSDKSKNPDKSKDGKDGNDGNKSDKGKDPDKSKKDNKDIIDEAKLDEDHEASLVDNETVEHPTEHPTTSPDATSTINEKFDNLAQNLRDNGFNADVVSAR